MAQAWGIQLALVSPRAGAATLSLNSEGCLGAGVSGTSCVSISSLKVIPPQNIPELWKIAFTASPTPVPPLGLISQVLLTLLSLGGCSLQDSCKRAPNPRSSSLLRAKQSRAGCQPCSPPGLTPPAPAPALDVSREGGVAQPRPPPLWWSVWRRCSLQDVWPGYSEGKERDSWWRGSVPTEGGRGDTSAYSLGRAALATVHSILGSGTLGVLSVGFLMGLPGVDGFNGWSKPAFIYFIFLAAATSGILCIFLAVTACLGYLDVELHLFLSWWTFFQSNWDTCNGML